MKCFINYSYSFVRTCSRQIFACTLFRNVLLHSQSKPRYIELKSRMNCLIKICNWMRDGKFTQTVNSSTFFILSSPSILLAGPAEQTIFHQKYLRILRDIIGKIRRPRNHFRIHINMDKTFTENWDSKRHLLELFWPIQRLQPKLNFFRNKTFLFFKIES